MLPAFFIFSKQLSLSYQFTVVQQSPTQDLTYIESLHHGAIQLFDQQTANQVINFLFQVLGAFNKINGTVNMSI
jgi:hypothetical protein